MFLGGLEEVESLFPPYPRRAGRGSAQILPAQEGCAWARCPARRLPGLLRRRCPSLGQRGDQPQQQTLVLVYGFPTGGAPFVPSRRVEIGVRRHISRGAVWGGDAKSGVTLLSFKLLCVPARCSYNTCSGSGRAAQQVPGTLR